MMNQLTPTNWIAILAACVTAIGVLISLLTNTRTLLQNNHFKRAEWLMTTTQQFHRDPLLVRLFDAIQYDKFTFDSSNGPGSQLGTKEEMELIYWLDFLNSVSDAVDEKLLTINHLRSCTLGYAIDKTLENKSIQQYLKHVAAYDMERKSDLVSWGLLRRRDHEAFTYLRRMSQRYKNYESRMGGGGNLGKD
jgi:hypothetical protein